MRKRIIAAILAAIILQFCATGIAEEAWVLCNPKSHVNIRLGSSKKSMLIGTLECGDVIETDWQEKNGWIHITAESAECGDGWIRKGYITQQQPVIEQETTYIISSNQPVLCRNKIDGKVIKRLYNGDIVKVYSHSDWAVTNKGYIKYEFLEVNIDE